MTDPSPSTLEHDILIQAAPARVLGAFFDAASLHVWWHTVRSVTTPRPLGVFAVEWAPGEVDEVLGRLGGVFYGTVLEYTPARELFVADAWWIPPDGEPLGPMALTVRTTAEGAGCRLLVIQSGFEDGPRWARYHQVISRGWRASLASLKQCLESEPVSRAAGR